MALFHVWFGTKKRKWILEGDLADMAERAIWEASRAHRIHLLECKSAIDHVHLLVELESADKLPTAMKALKGRSARRVMLQADTLKFDAKIDNLWQRGYGWKPVPPGAQRAVRRYIRTQMDRLQRFER